MQKSYDNGRFSYSGLQEQVIGNIMADGTKTMHRFRQIKRGETA